MFSYWGYMDLYKGEREDALKSAKKCLDEKDFRQSFSFVTSVRYKRVTTLFYLTKGFRNCCSVQPPLLYYCRQIFSYFGTMLAYARLLCYLLASV